MMSKIIYNQKKIHEIHTIKRLIYYFNNQILFFYRAFRMCATVYEIRLIQGLTKVCNAYIKMRRIILYT